jgi:hypothetical protein
VLKSSGFSVILIGEFAEAIHFRTNENRLYKQVSDYRSSGSIHDVIHESVAAHIAMA